jgi:formylglycine-generating enzyme required for sulfatase activity
MLCALVITVRLIGPVLLCRAADQPPALPLPATEAQEKWARALKSKVETTSATGLKMRLIPPGEFLMGSTDADIEEILKVHAVAKREWWKGEQPQHKVRLAAPFYLGMYEVTQDEYEQELGHNPSWFARGENQVLGASIPVVCRSSECHGLTQWRSAIS